MTPDSFTRRRLLAAVAGAGMFSVGAERAGAISLDPVELNQRTVNGTYAQTTGFVDAPPRIALTWREIVNGEIQEDTGLTTDAEGETGNVGLIVDEAVVPGDTGSVTMRAELLEREDQPTADTELYLLFRLSNTAENDVNEPEREASDATPNDGELDDYTQVTVWEDDGILTGNGDLENLPVIGDTPVVQGSLNEVATESELDGDALANTGGYQIALDGETCLSPGDEVYVSFRWDVPETAGNVIQGDSATFQVIFDPRPCEGG